MAIIKSFAGRNIRKPGAYSRSLVDNSGGSPIQSNDTIFIIGESELGAPGDVEGIQSFSAGQLDQLVSKYGSANHISEVQQIDEISYFYQFQINIVSCMS